MKKLMRILRRVRVKIVRSSRRTKMAVVCMVALSMAALLALNLTINAFRAQTEAARKEAAQKEHENSQLEDKIEDLGSEGSIEDIAKDELGMVPTDAIVIQPGQQ